MHGKFARQPLSPALRSVIFAARGWLSHVSAATRDRVLDVAEERQFDAGETIVSAGVEGGGPYGVLSGRIGCWVHAPLVDPVLGHVASPGDWLGEGPLVIGQPRSISFRALEDSHLLYLTATTLRRLRETLPDFASDLARLPESNAQTAVALVAELLVPDSERRLALAVLRVARTPVDLDRADSALPLSQAQLAEMVALSRNHVNRILAQWSQAGLVATGYNHLRLLSIDRLTAIAAGEGWPRTADTAPKPCPWLGNPP